MNMFNDVFLRACRRERTNYTPVWMMRQAGRYITEYRELRKTHSVLEICKTPELCSSVTMMPVEQLNVDAAIMFADIMLPLEGMGIELDIREGGPVIANPVRDAKSVSGLRESHPKESVPFVLEAIRLIKKQLNVPLIGFSGAPFTLASYIIEGGPSRTFTLTKLLMYSKPDVWQGLMERLTRVVLAYLNAQINAGVDAVQLFDSWAGCLSPQDYREFVLPYSGKVFKGLQKVPSIHFGTGTSELLGLMKEAGGDVIGIDWRVPLGRAWERLGHDVGIQGNLDPSVLLGREETIKKRVLDVLGEADDRPGHIFNLGHGVLPETPPANAAAMVKAVHEYSQRDA